MAVSNYFFLFFRFSNFFLNIFFLQILIFQQLFYLLFFEHYIINDIFWITTIEYHYNLSLFLQFLIMNFKELVLINFVTKIQYQY